jgi:hypothetical protein
MLSTPGLRRRALGALFHEADALHALVRARGATVRTRRLGVAVRTRGLCCAVTVWAAMTMVTLVGAIAVMAVALPSTMPVTVRMMTARRFCLRVPAALLALAVATPAVA